MKEFGFLLKHGNIGHEHQIYLKVKSSIEKRTISADILEWYWDCISGDIANIGWYMHKMIWSVFLTYHLGWSQKTIYGGGISAISEIF